MANLDPEDPGDSGTDCECACCCGGEDRGRGGGGAGRERRGSLWRVALAEALGAALLLLLTCLASCGPARGAGGDLQRALTAGLSVALVVQCFDHISGAQVNPAVTLAALVTGRVGARRAACMVGAQLAGALLGAGLAAAGGGVGACVSRVGAVSAGRAAALEALAAGVLALANCAAWDSRCAAHTDSWPLRIGFVVAALTLIIGEATGASMNPARSLAPALWAAHWEHLWVYWVGPLGGAGAVAALYRAVWGPAERAPLHPPPSGARRLRHAASTPPATRSPAHSERSRKSSQPSFKL